MDGINKLIKKKEILGWPAGIHAIYIINKSFLFFSKRDSLGEPLVAFIMHEHIHRRHH